MNDNLQTLTTSTASERKIGAGGVAVLAVAELRQAAYDAGYADAMRVARTSAEPDADLSAVGLAQLIAELVERCRQDSYDEGYADAQQAARQDAEAQR